MIDLEKPIDRFACIRGNSEPRNCHPMKFKPFLAGMGIFKVKERERYGEWPF